MEWTVGMVLALQDAGVSMEPGLVQMMPYAEVVVWAQERHGPPTWEDIKNRWNTSRATAFRWLPELRRARGERRRA
jgi:hypothetical protein